MLDQNSVATLRNMLFQMEVDLGMADLSHVEKDVYHAARLSADQSSNFRGEEVRDQPFVRRISRPTFYRVSVVE